MMNVRAVAGVWIAVTLAACGQAVETRTAPGGPAGSPSEQPTAAATAPTSSTSTTSSTGPAEDAAVVAYAFDQDIWVYHRRSGQVDRVTSDRYERTDHSPRFRDRDHLTFVSMAANKDHSALVEVDLARGTRRTLFAVDNALWAYDWSADGSRVAYVASVAGAVPGSGAFAHEVRLVSPDGHVSVLRRFDGLSGRGGFANYDDVHVDWSADGSRMLLVDTHLDGLGDGAETIFVLSLDGADMVAPRTGTWGRWGADSRTVVYVDDSGKVRALDTGTGSLATLMTNGPARRLAMSPDGRLLAYDDGAADPTVHLYDLERRSGRRAAPHAVGPLWLSPGTLAAGHARPCAATEATDCEAGGHGTPWSEAGDGWRIDAASGAVTRLPVASTLDAAVAG